MLKGEDIYFTKHNARYRDLKTKWALRDRTIKRISEMSRRLADFSVRLRNVEQMIKEDLEEKNNPVP